MLKLVLCCAMSYLDRQKDLVINFIDFKKASDSVHRPSLWKILEYYGIPEQYIKIFKTLYENSSCHETHRIL